MQRVEVFDTFCHDVQPERRGERHGEGHDRFRLRVGDHVMHEAAVDLEGRDGQLSEVGDRRVPGPEVVDRDGNAKRRK